MGWAAGNAAGTIIIRATIAMLVCWAIGLFIGGIAQRAVEDQVERYKDQNPLPDNPDENAQTLDEPAADELANQEPETELVANEPMT